VEYKNGKEKFMTDVNFPKCSGELSPVIEIWNHTGSNFIIGDWGQRDDIYLKSEGLNSSEYPYPKKFDLKLTIVNNPILFDNPNYKIQDWHLYLLIKYKVGQNQDAVYPLNAKILEPIEIINDKLITSEDFRNNGEITDHIDIWQKDIEFESNFLKYRNHGLFINQIVFEIRLISESKDSCVYEYVFLMSDRGE
jgi:hypothetical protein